MRILWSVFPSTFLTYKGTSEGLITITGISIVLHTIQDAFVYVSLGSAMATLLETSLFH